MTSSRQQLDQKGYLGAAHGQNYVMAPQADDKDVQGELQQDKIQQTSVTVSPLEDEDDGGDTQTRYTRGRKSSRTAFKERGSIIAHIRDDVTIPSGSRTKVNAPSNRRKEREKRYLGAPKKVDRNIFIPSIVSVGNLARLLNVRLGIRSSATQRHQRSRSH